MASKKRAVSVQPRKKPSRRSPSKSKSAPKKLTKRPAPEVEPALPEPPATGQVQWRLAAGGLVLGGLAYKLVFPASPFFGLLGLGLATLMLGYAVGRD